MFSVNKLPSNCLVFTIFAENFLKMKSYKSLRLIATMLKVIAWVELIAGSLASFTLIVQISGRDYGEYHNVMVNDYTYTFLLVIGCLVAFLLLLGIAEFILLTVGLADHVGSIANNVYALAQKFEPLKKDVEDYEL